MKMNELNLDEGYFDINENYNPKNIPLKDQNDYKDKKDYILRQLADPKQKDNWEHFRARLHDLEREARNKGLNEDWNKVNKHDHTDGLSRKAVNAYRREHPGSKLKTAVTTKPSKLKKGSKASKRRKSFCARMSGMKKHRAGAKTKRDPNSPINKALRRWNCESIEDMRNLIEHAELIISYERDLLSEIKKGQKDSNGFTKCWPGKHAEGTKKGKNGKPVRNCVPNESVAEAANAAQQAAIAVNMKKAGKKPKHAPK